MHPLLSCAGGFIGCARVSGRLYNLGDYPGLVITGQTDAKDRTKRPGCWVKSELYTPNINDDLPLTTNTYADCAATQPTPHEFKRIAMDTQLANSMTARTGSYAYTMTTIGKPEITCGDSAEYHAKG